MTWNDTPEATLARLAGGLVVSCQAYPGEPLRHPETLARMAQAVVVGGAVAVRMQGLQAIRLAKQRVDVPIIGLWKDGTDAVFITPTLRHATAVRDAGADVVALDGTRRPRPDGLSLRETIRRLKQDRPILVMADCSSVADALEAHECEADLIGTTLAGYTDDRVRSDGPDLELIALVAERAPEARIVAEGRIHTPQQARTALDAGAYAVVVGTAITHPTTITTWFSEAVTRCQPDSEDQEPTSQQER